MLKSLEINDYAIISQLKLDFFSGMTVLTGETGAGKSIIVDAISLLLGERASRDMIASDKESAYVKGVFSLDIDALKEILKQNDIDYDDEIIIERTISTNNRNIIKVNGDVSSIKVLKDLAIYLADIHSQFDTNRLINPDNYLSLIDHFRKDKIAAYISNYQTQLKTYRLAFSDYQQTLKEKDQTLAKLDLYAYQLKELKQMALEADEDSQLEEQISLMENMDKIHSTLEKFDAVIQEREITDSIYMLKQDLDLISKTSSDFERLSERMNDVYYELDDIHQSLNDLRQSLDYDQADYDQMQQRLNDIERIKRKYQKSVEELIDYQAYLEAQVNRVENYDALIDEKKALVEERYLGLLKDAVALRQFRSDIAQTITKQIKETLHDLVLIHADFDIRFDDKMPKDSLDHGFFKDDGIDQIDFYITTNKGEPLKPLSLTASGGEMSRVMLAFKAIFVRSNKLSTIIFDEIDTGISGYIAKQIANKIKEIAKLVQVISITHIPQVVATGMHHIAVRKTIEKNKTKTTVSYLDYSERIEEIAKMISADQVTKAALESAKELLVSD